MKLPLYLAVALSIGFVILSLPNAYIFTDSVIPKNYIRITFDNCPGVPTTQGIVVHALIFLIFAFIVLNFKYPKIENNLPVPTLNDIKTTQNINKRNELPIRRKLSPSEPIEMDPFEMYDE